jgi:hypothetical protein
MTPLTRLVRPRQFLLLGGTVLVIIGVAGAAGLLGSISRASVFNPPYWINWIHLTFGIVVLAIAFAGGRTLENGITLAAGIMGSSRACCSAPMPRNVTTCRNWQTRPTTSLISVCLRFGRGRTGKADISCRHRFAERFITSMPAWAPRGTNLSRFRGCHQQIGRPRLMPRSGTPAVNPTSVIRLRIPVT